MDKSYDREKNYKCIIQLKGENNGKHHKFL